jgi:UrcA family protein
MKEQTMSTSVLIGAAGLKTSRLLLVAAGAAAVALLCAAPARAGTEDPLTQQIKVRFGDLNPSSPKDAKRLYLRIRNAAETVCGDYDLLDLYDMQNAHKCQDEAIGQAVEQINRPLLTAVYDRSHPHA